MIRVALLLLCLAGCATAGKGIGGAALGVETLADQIRIACGNAVPDGPCAPDSVLETSEKQGLKTSLQIAVTLLERGDAALLAGDAIRAATNTRQAEAILEAVARFLQGRGI